jgi:hypothetical protein
MNRRALRTLQALLCVVAIFHLVAGLGLMFSISFQRFAVASYGARLAWDAHDIYFLRIIGSFAFVLGTIAALAARDPLKHAIVVVGFIEFFVLRNVHRHLYSRELYEGFGVSSVTNDLTTVFFGIQAIALAALLWRASRSARITSDSPVNVHD